MAFEGGHLTTAFSMRWPESMSSSAPTASCWVQDVSCIHATSNICQRVPPSVLRSRHDRERVMIGEEHLSGLARMPSPSRSSRLREAGSNPGFEALSASLRVETTEESLQCACIVSHVRDTVHLEFSSCSQHGSQQLLPSYLRIGGPDKSS